MPPNRPTLYKNKKASKPTKIQPQNVTQITEIPSTSNPEVPNQEQFELELCWCIQQLQKGLSLGKLNNKQVQDHTKALNVLMSTTAPIIKKRQVMRLSFGDYREKMKAEEKKAQKNATRMKLQSASPNKKTVFLKKSVFSSSSNEAFKFNFNIDEHKEEDKLEESSEKNQEIKTDCKLYFTPSNNNFRFNFQLEEES